MTNAWADFDDHGDLDLFVGWAFRAERPMTEAFSVIINGSEPTSSKHFMHE
jgi:hypothetical protein